MTWVIMGVLQYLTVLGGSAKLSPVADSYELPASF